MHAIKGNALTNILVVTSWSLGTDSLTSALPNHKNSDLYIIYILYMIILSVKPMSLIRILQTICAILKTVRQIF